MLPEMNLSLLLQPFVDQSASIRSIVAIGIAQPFPAARHGRSGFAFDPAEARAPSCFGRRRREALLPGFDAWDAIPLAASRPDADRLPTLDRLAAEARALTGGASGDDLLLLPADVLREAMTPVTDGFGFRAVAVLLPQSPESGGDADAWKLQRDLFDRGLVCIASVDIGGCTARCFLASDAVRTVNWKDTASRGRITVATLGTNGRFANQLFQYSYARLYALRHGLTAAFPAWDGRRLFGLDDAVLRRRGAAAIELRRFHRRRPTTVGAGRSADRRRPDGLLPGDARLLATPPAAAEAPVPASRRATAGHRRLASSGDRGRAENAGGHPCAARRLPPGIAAVAVAAPGSGSLVSRLVAGTLADAEPTPVVRRHRRARSDRPGVPGVRHRVGDVRVSGGCVAGRCPRFRGPATRG